jgi:type IV pilus assembly protein PilV
VKYSRTNVGMRGFSLVEVMVAVVVICVGLLGIAKMQALALSNSNTSRLRSLAAIEAAGLAAAMHSNREYWAGSTGAAPPATINVNALLNPQIQSSDAALQAAAGVDLAEAIGNNASLIVNPCVGTNNGNPTPCGALGDPASPGLPLAAFDLARWTASLNVLLPSPQSTITCGTVPGINSPVSCTIQITWNEKAVSMTQQEAQQEATNGPSQIEKPVYFLYVEP